ncbi:Hypothetical predicted protein [Octopus vulgaris]|uniref:von Willebrand factor A domain-containing protein 3B n=1 Tax=Octopus vulgaris TaxID=6645 RepID=A0AA36BWX4_OCTVU|nr:Hypothetical predicted protein [Octopus vulgaris]
MKIVCCRVKLQSIAERLEYFLRLYRQRLYWLISGSRKIFGVIEETSICLVLVPSIEVECEERWSSLKKFLGFLLTEQVAQLRHFNIVIVSGHIDRFHPEMVRVCHDSIHKAVEWLQDKPRPMVSTLSICEAVVAVMEDQKMDAIYLIVEGTAKHFCQEILKDKTSSVKVIDAKYCSTFPLVKMASGEAMHVYITPKFHRQYEEKMSPVLKNIHQRLHWLKTNNRAIFGSLCEDQIYILIDMSSSMLPKIEFVLEKTESFIKEQLQDKTFNLVIFNKTATAWKKNLAEAAQYCHRDAVSWLQKQPAKLLLSQVDMYPTIPVHTVSFNCNDVEANEFLCQLAQLTDGRYRHYNCNTGPHLCRPHCWKSDDQRLLEEELKEASENLDFMSKLRNHCTTAVWKKEISRIKDSKINNSLLSCEGSGSSDLSSRGTYQSVDKLEFPVPTHSIPRKCYSFQKNPESFYYKEKSHKFPPQQKNILFAGSTKTSYLRLKNIKKGSRPISRETQEKKAETKANSSPVCPRPPLILRERKPRSIIKEWLRHNSLRRKKLSLLDVLSSTCIPHGAKYIPVLNKHALTRVFKEVFPFAYLLEEKGMEMNLVNPGAVDLADYEEELAKAIHLYTNYLDAAIWNALPESSKTRFQSDSPVSYLSNKPRLLHALHEAGWPLAKDDVILLEREIEQGFKYLNLAKNLRNHQLADNSSEAK